MTIETHDSIPDSLCDRVFALLSACDSEFVPPLSHRISTSQRNLTPNSESIGENGVSEYFEQMRHQRLIVALGRNTERDRELLAFLSYIPSYNLPVDAHDEETSYVTTVCTAPVIVARASPDSCTCKRRRRLEPRRCPSGHGPRTHHRCTCWPSSGTRRSPASQTTAAKAWTPCTS